MANPLDDLPEHNQLLHRPATAENGFPAMLQRLASRFTPATIIDVGASDGRWSRMAHEVWPEANLLLIEANQDAFFDALRDFCREVPHATAMIRLCTRDGMVAERVRFGIDDPFQGVYRADGLESGTFVPCTTIDRSVVLQTDASHYDAPTVTLPGPYLIKLDVHGREHEILAGARETLKNTGAIVAEVYTWSQGANSMRAAELIPHIEREHGFLPSDLCEPLRRPLDGRLVQVDLLLEPKTAPGMDTARYR